jgi:hypothetical protein
MAHGNRIRSKSSIIQIVQIGSLLPLNVVPHFFRAGMVHIETELYGKTKRHLEFASRRGISVALESWIWQEEEEEEEEAQGEAARKELRMFPKTIIEF